MLKAKRKIKKRNIVTPWSVAPLAGLLVFGMVDFTSGHDSVQEAAQAGNIYLTLVRAMLYAAGALFLLKGFKRNLNWLGSRVELLLCLIFVLMTVAWTSYPDRLVINWIHFFGGCIAAYSAAKYFSRKPEHFFDFLSIATGLAIVGSLIAVFVLPDKGQQYFQWEEVYRWRGLTTNPNSLGLIGLITIWSNAASFMTTDNNRMKALNGVFVLSAAICLVGAESRTSQILSVLAVGLTALLFFIMKDSNAGKRNKLMLLGYLATIVTVIILWLFGDFFVAENAAGSIGRESNLSGRTYIWQDAFKMIAMHPLIGWSFDGHLSAYDVINQEVGHYHNGFIDLTVNGGFIGISLFLAFIFRIFADIYKMMKMDYQRFAPLVALMVVFLIYNLTEVTLGAFVNPFWIIILFGYFYTALSIKHLRRKKTPNKFVTVPKKQQKRSMMDGAI